MNYNFNQISLRHLPALVISGEGVVVNSLNFSYKIGSPTPPPLRLPIKNDYLSFYLSSTCYKFLLGVEFNFIPDTKGKPLVCDMSSNIMTREFDITKVSCMWCVKNAIKTERI